ncbi:MAG: hybrid sensor histidine kinase/response regulator [Leptospiraceae bacterium]|nr:hybrid sensor histidine kinase/response regulator [Leptospiraceae bacterium]MCP5501008.1 hybrid sensor histidine kinase/response regulator [Leptospiraceae bacterium]
MELKINRNALINTENESKNFSMLIVDDEESNLRVLRRIFEDNFTLYEAKNGKIALEIIKNLKRNETIHVIITDQRMPVLNGVELLADSIQYLPKSIRIILTAYTDIEAVIDAINKGQVYKFISKPYDPADLRITVFRAMEALELELKNNELEKINKSKDKIFAIISHDLRSPIGSIKNLITLLQTEDVSKEEFIHLSGKLKNSIESIHFTLENLLQWAQSQMKGITTIKKPFFLNPIILKVFDFFKETARVKNIKISIEVNESIQILADEEQIRLVLRNLLSNSIKFTDHDGSIRVSATTNNHSCMITILDSGIGISQTEISEILEGKYVSNYGTDGEKGTGLGLVLCKEFITYNGGSLSIESTPGQGSSFCVTLPLTNTPESL